MNVTQERKRLPLDWLIQPTTGCIIEQESREIFLTFLSFYLSIFLSFYFSIFLFFNLSIFLSFYFSKFLSFYLSIFLNLYLSFFLSVYLSFFLSFSLFFVMRTWAQLLQLIKHVNMTQIFSTLKFNAPNLVNTRINAHLVAFSLLISKW